MRCAYPWMLSIAGLCGCATNTTQVVVTTTQDTTTTAGTTGDEPMASATSTGASSSTEDSASTQSVESSTSDASTSDASSTGSEDSSSSDGGASISGDTTSESSECLDMSGCAAGCEVEYACADEWQSAQECTDWCEANLVKAEEFSCFCAQAWNNLSTCFGPLTCEEYAQYLEPTMFPYPCAIESDSLAFECKGQ